MRRNQVKGCPRTCSEYWLAQARIPELIPSTTMWMMRRGVPEARGRFSVLDFLGAWAAAPNAVAVSAETAGAVTSDLRKCRRGFIQVVQVD